MVQAIQLNPSSVGKVVSVAMRFADLRVRNYRRAVEKIYKEWMGRCDPNSEEYLTVRKALDLLQWVTDE